MPEIKSPERLISWNVNGLRAVAEKAGFFSWLSACGADVVCLQEVKACPEQLDPEALAACGYQWQWACGQKKGYSGVAVFHRVPPLEVRTSGRPEFDDEGRYLELVYPRFHLVCAYFPNSQEGGKRLPYKLAFCDFMLARCEELRSSGRNVVVCGDYNIAHREIDLANPKQNEGNPGYLPEERAWMDRFTAAGYVDTFRRFNSQPEHYTWWSYRTRARERNVGWRIDYFCTNPELAPAITRAEIWPHVMGSDHCPVYLELRQRRGQT